MMAPVSRRTGLVLRPYQRAAIDAVFAWVREHTGHPLIVIPTGGGKSLVMGTLIAEALERQAGGRALLLAHRKELLQQNVRAVATCLPLGRIGIYSAGLRRKDRDVDILVAGIQSFAKQPMSAGGFDLVLIDECHLVPNADGTMYRKTIEALLRMNPGTVIIGLTATPYRLDAGFLHRGEGALFTDIAYEASVTDLIAEGYLCPLTSLGTATKLSVAGVGTRGGEFIAGQLARAVDQDELTQAIVDEVLARAGERHHWVFFCAGVEHAVHVGEVLRSRGIPAAAVHGELSPLDRAERLEAFHEGTIRALTSVEVLTTGWDEPAIDLIALLRPTKSAGLFTQMCGRGFRKHDSKQDCVAKGSMVLTTHGLVPIERVTTAMRVWDGVEWVSHNGVICHGTREVITYAGLTATPEHRVWGPEGWKTFGQCALEQTPIAVTGISRYAVREAEGYQRGSHPARRRRKGSHPDAMLTLPCHCDQGIHQPDAGDGGMSVVRIASPSASMADAAGISGSATVHQSARTGIQELWSEGDRVPVCVSDGDGRLCPDGAGTGPVPANRPHQQRRTLRARKPAAGYCAAERVESPPPGTTEVWDLINAGPRHRFTVNGLLVSNCLILDFAGNVARHGPVDAIVIADKALGVAGDAPVKECPVCRHYVLAGLAACPHCAHEFPPPEKEEIQATASDLPILSSEPVRATWHEVSGVWYSRHEKEGKLPSLRVDYVRGYRTVASEWVCLEHAGYARQKAEVWWRTRDGWDHPVPRTIDEALALVDELPSPVAIATVPEGKWTRVAEVRFAEGAVAPLTPRVIEAAPAATPCLGCDFFVEPTGFCLHWRDEVPAAHQAAGCPQFQAPDDLPF